MSPWKHDGLNDGPMPVGGGSKRTRVPSPLEMMTKLAKFGQPSAKPAQPSASQTPPKDKHGEQQSSGPTSPPTATTPPPRAPQPAPRPNKAEIDRKFEILKELKHHEVPAKVEAKSIQHEQQADIKAELQKRTAVKSFSQNPAFAHQVRFGAISPNQERKEERGRRGNDDEQDEQKEEEEEKEEEEDGGGGEQKG